MTTKKVAPKQVANKKKDSLVKVVVSDDKGEWVSPEKSVSFEIDENATFPSVTFEIKTEQAPPYKWSWSISWDAKVSGLRESAKRGSLLKTFSEKSSFDSSERKWTVNLAKVIGGRLVVEVVAGTETFKRSVQIKGKNPAADSVKQFVATIANADGFERLLEQESRFKNFIAADGHPIVAFDKGYGMTQMTNPAPTYEQVWSWKENINAGVRLYQSKQKEAKTYLSQQSRTYTPEQLRLETWSRWNGGAYHVWDAKDKAWKRNDTLLCDSETGNIGWDMTKEGNKDKPEKDLHDRDKASYGNPKKNKGPENEWRYTGVCYADHVNSQ
jgi:hypothetical protein